MPRLLLSPDQGDASGKLLPPAGSQRVHLFPAFVEVASKKYCQVQEKVHLKRYRLQTGCPFHSICERN